jgi:carboxypeptidase D
MKRTFFAVLKQRFRLRGCLIAALAWLVCFAVSTQAQTNGTAGLAGKGAGPRFGPITRITITITNHADLERLVQAGYDLAGVRGNQVTIYADSDELSSLTNAGWQVNILPSPAASSGLPTTKSLGTYNNYTNMTAMLQFYATNCPAICRRFSLGKSVQGRDLWAMKITTKPDAPAGKPKFEYISTMHGNEPLGTEMCLYLLDRLTSGYATNDARIVNLVTNVEIWLLPLLNPDGREANPPQRYNANGYDLNRAFPEGSAANLGNLLYGPALNTNGFQPEVSEVMAWTAAHHFTLGANYHTGDLVVNYPYDNDNLGSVFSPTPDEALLETMSLTYSSNNVPMWNSPYFANGIVNGAAWYAISGGMQDWNYRYAGCFDVTIEISESQWPYPSASEIPVYWSQNQESMLAYMEWVLKGIRGVMSDAQTGQPVAGAVRVEGYPHLVLSDPAAGDYHRLLLPGTYTMWFTAPGYMPQRISNVAVGSGNATRLDVQLQPVSSQFGLKVNFQPASATLPAGFLADSGAAFGNQGNGYSYGWETGLSTNNVIARNAACSQDLRYDTLCQMQADGSHVWAVAVPNGRYLVHLVAGDPLYTSGLYRIMVKNILMLNGVSSASNRWVEGLGTVVITNGLLTISNAPGSISNRIAYVEISAVAPATIAQWRAVYFGTTNNLGGAADNADPDGDGIPNLLEYAFGLAPTTPDSYRQVTPVIRHTNNAAWFGCSFPRNTNATDLTFVVQAASSLTSQNWSNIASYTIGSGWTGPSSASESYASPGVLQVTVRDTEPIPANTNRFLRVQVSGP